MVECIAIKFPNDTVLDCFNGCCARSIVQKSKFTEAFTWHVGLKSRRLGLSFENLSAEKRSGLKNIHAITIIAFFDDTLTSWCINFFDCINNCCKFLFVQSIKHKCLQKTFLKLYFCLVSLGHNFRLEIALFVKSSINFGGNTSPLFDWLSLFGLRFLLAFFTFITAWSVLSLAVFV